MLSGHEMRAAIVRVKLIPESNFLNNVRILAKTVMSLVCQKGDYSMSNVSETTSVPKDTDIDVIEYLNCLAAGRPFEAKYTLFGNLTVMFRELSLHDIRLLDEAEQTQNINRKQAEVFAAISRFENQLQNKTHLFKPVSELARSTQNVVSHLVRWFCDNIATTTTIYTAIEHVYDDFKQRLEKIVKRAADPDFFVNTSQQEQ